MPYAVYDWAGNRMNWGTFPSFEDAWSEIIERVPDEEGHGDYFVGDTANERMSRYLEPNHPNEGRGKYA